MDILKLESVPHDVVKRAAEWLQNPELLRTFKEVERQFVNSSDRTGFLRVLQDETLFSKRIKLAQDHQKEQERLAMVKVMKQRRADRAKKQQIISLKYKSNLHQWVDADPVRFPPVVIKKGTLTFVDGTGTQHTYTGDSFYTYATGLARIENQMYVDTRTNRVFLPPLGSVLLCRLDNLVYFGRMNTIYEWNTLNNSSRSFICSAGSCVASRDDFIPVVNNVLKLTRGKAFENFVLEKCFSVMMLTGSKLKTWDGDKYVEMDLDAHNKERMRLLGKAFDKCPEDLKKHIYKYVSIFA